MNIKKNINKKRGSFSLGIALATPFILIFFFMLFDFMNLIQTKTMVQRQLDSAVITIVQSAQKQGDFLVNEEGYIVLKKEGNQFEVTSQKAREITNEDFQKGVAQITKLNGNSVVIANYDATGAITNQDDLDRAQLAIYNVSTPEQMENGVARIQAKGYIGLMANIFGDTGIRWPYVVEAYAVYNISPTKPGIIE